MRFIQRGEGIPDSRWEDGAKVIIPNKPTDTIVLRAKPDLREPEKAFTSKAVLPKVPRSVPMPQNSLAGS